MSVPRALGTVIAVSPPSSHRASIAIVAACTCVGLLSPAHAGQLLALPLLVGLVVLGVAHGACDHLVLPAPPSGASSRRWRAGLLVAYVTLIVGVVAVWWYVPAVALIGFFALSAWHWGSADAIRLRPGARTRGPLWYLHGLTRGTLLFAVPALGRGVETRALCNELLEFAHGPLIARCTFDRAALALGVLAVLGLTVCWTAYSVLGAREALRTDLLEVAVLCALLLALPPALASAVYFVGWHSLRHAARLSQLLPGRAQADTWREDVLRFAHAAWPLSAVSILGLCLVALAIHHVAGHVAPLALLLVAASAVTLPHAIVVTFLDVRGPATPAPRGLRARLERALEV